MKNFVYRNDKGRILDELGIQVRKKWNLVYNGF